MSTSTNDDESRTASGNGMLSYAIRRYAMQAAAAGGCPKCDFCTEDAEEMVKHLTEKHSFRDFDLNI